MRDFKAEVTLNEKDSLQDLLNLEKSLVKIYATAITEGCSNGYRKQIKQNLLGNIDLQMEVFLLMTEHGYYQVESATEQMLEQTRKTFEPIKKQLS